jgi:hypothetical protein
MLVHCSKAPGVPTLRSKAAIRSHNTILIQKFGFFWPSKIDGGKTQTFDVVLYILDGSVINSRIIESH